MILVQLKGQDEEMIYKVDFHQDEDRMRIVHQLISQTGRDFIIF